MWSKCIFLIVCLVLLAQLSTASSLAERRSRHQSLLARRAVLKNRLTSAILQSRARAQLASEAQLEGLLPDELREVSPIMGFPFLMGRLTFDVIGVRYSKPEKDFTITLEFANHRQVTFAKMETPRRGRTEMDLGSFTFSVFPHEFNYPTFKRGDDELIIKIKVSKWLGLNSDEEIVFRAPIRESEHDWHKAHKWNVTSTTNNKLLFDHGLRVRASYTPKDKASLASLELDQSSDSVNFDCPEDCQRAERDSEYDMPEMVTNQFKSLIEVVQGNKHAAIESFKRSFPDFHQKYQVILCPGFLTAFYPGYFSGNKAMLEDLGIHRIESDLHTIKGVAHNIEVLDREVREQFGKSGKKIILIGHSKGGTDIFGLVAEHARTGDRKFKDMIAACVTLNAPLWGIEILDSLYGSGLSGPVKAALNLLGDKSSLTDMNVLHMRDLVRKAGGIDQILDYGVPFLCLGSWVQAEDFPFGVGSVLKLLHNLQLGYSGFENDGIIAPETTLLPAHDSVKTVLYEGVDHGVQALYMPGQAVAPSEFTFATMTVLAEWLDDSAFQAPTRKEMEKKEKGFFGRTWDKIKSF